MNRGIAALAVSQAGIIYAGGEFTSVGGTTVNHIAQWNGSDWAPFGTGVQGNVSRVYALAVDHADNLYVGGSFSSIDGTAANAVAQWNGHAWSGLNGGVSDHVFAFAVDQENDLYVGGLFVFAGTVADI